MTARFVYWMNVSLDLKIERSAGEDGGGEWLRIDEALHREFNARAERMSMMIEGRKIYEIMEDYWPAASQDASLPDYLQEYGGIWTDASKVLVSRTRTTAGHNTRVIGGEGDEDAIEQLRMLRAEQDGDIGVGGATLATQLLRAGLLDELLLFTHPVVLGEGRPLFDPPAEGESHTPVQLDLLEQQTFSQGVTLHRYAVRSSREP